MTTHIILLLAGMILLIKGADWFVSGSSEIAKALKIPALIIGLTLVSIGTSAPEASVSINSAINGMSDLSIGNIVGSNIFNTLFILGLCSVITPLSIGKDIKKYDIPIMVVLYGILLVFSFVISPLKLDLPESIILLFIFIAYTLFLILRAKKDCYKNDAAKQNGIKSQQDKKPKPLFVYIVLTVTGLAGIILGGDLVVDHAAAIANMLGMSEALVGLTIVAVGTSLPELVTSITASLKNENDIAIGNVIGSNIFNIIFILGISSSINTLTIDLSTLFDMLVMMCSGIIILTTALLSKKTSRWQGLAMTLFYAGYLTYIIIRN